MNRPYRHVAINVPDRCLDHAGGVNFRNDTITHVLLMGCDSYFGPLGGEYRPLKSATM
jgi:hypothetical protein